MEEIREEELHARGRNADIAKSPPSSPLPPTSADNSSAPTSATTTGAQPAVRFVRRFSLVHQASLETAEKIGVKRQNTLRRRSQLQQTMHANELLRQLNDEGVDLIWRAKGEQHLNFAVCVSASGTLCDFLTVLLACFSRAGVAVEHVETRPSKTTRENGGHKRVSTNNQQRQQPSFWDVLLRCGATKEQLVEAATALIDAHPIRRISLHGEYEQHEVPWFPRHVSDLDDCANTVTKYEPTVDPRHPGHGDEVYIARRAALNAQASNYKHGQPIPFVQYTPEENRTWAEVYAKLKTLHLSHTCATYRRNLTLLEAEGVVTPHAIPQLEDVNRFLQRRTGFQLRPCSGLLSARDFLASLAFRVFQATQYVRHWAHPHHSPEPDVIHELLGHVPMFADPDLAQLSQDIGLMSLGATDEQIERLSTVYWFIVEFGLCREDGQLKAIGAGLLSAYGELMHACSNVPEHKPFEPALTAVQPYEDADYQPLYFVADSIQTAMAKVREYALSFRRPFHAVYDALTQSVHVVDDTDTLQQIATRFRDQLQAFQLSLDVVTKADKSCAPVRANKPAVGCNDENRGQSVI